MPVSWGSSLKQQAFFIVVLIQKEKMAVVDIATLTADFDTRATEETPAIQLRRDNSYLFYIRTATPNTVNPDAYLNIVATIFNGTSQVKTPLIAKYFFTGEEMMFLLPVPRVQNSNDQDVTIQILPREFYANRAPIRSIDVVIAYEDANDWNIATTFPGT